MSRACTRNSSFMQRYPLNIAVDERMPPHPNFFIFNFIARSYCSVEWPAAMGLTYTQNKLHLKRPWTLYCRIVTGRYLSSLLNCALPPHERVSMLKPQRELRALFQRWRSIRGALHWRFRSLNVCKFLSAAVLVFSIQQFIVRARVLRQNQRLSLRRKRWILSFYFLISADLRSYKGHRIIIENRYIFQKQKWIKDVLVNIDT